MNTDPKKRGPAPERLRVDDPEEALRRLLGKPPKDGKRPDDAEAEEPGAAPEDDGSDEPKEP